MCLGAAGAAQNLRGRTCLDDAPITHDRYPIGDAADHGEVVADQNDGGTALLHFRQQVEDLCLHCHIQGGRRLIRDEQWRIERDGRGDERPLPLTAGELPRSLSDPQFRVRQTHGLEEFLHTARSFGRPECGVQPKRVADLAPDRAQRIKRYEGILQHESDVAPTSPAPRRGGQTQHGATLNRHLVRAHPRPIPGEAEQAPRRDALARAGFADNSEAFASPDLERHAMNHGVLPRALTESHAQIAHFQREDGFRGQHFRVQDARTHACLIRRSILLPSIVAETAVITMKRPGEKLIHHAEVM